VRGEKKKEREGVLLSFSTGRHGEVKLVQLRSLDRKKERRQRNKYFGKELERQTRPV
jgi:hypothetical protein